MTPHSRNDSDRFQPPMVEEVRNHLREMLESGTIRPSQSAWCNAVVLVRKKDGGLHFCINFQCLNARTRTGFLPITPNTGGARELSRCQPLFLPGSEIWILADQDGQGIRSSTPLSPWVTWGSMSAIECLLDSAMCWLLSNGLCKIVWVS